jgi:hypothetical protein
MMEGYAKSRNSFATKLAIFLSNPNSEPYPLDSCQAGSMCVLQVCPVQQNELALWGWAWDCSAMTYRAMPSIASAALRGVAEAWAEAACKPAGAAAAASSSIANSPGAAAQGFEQMHAQHMASGAQWQGAAGAEGTFPSSSNTVHTVHSVPPWAVEAQEAASHTTIENPDTASDICVRSVQAAMKSCMLLSASSNLVHLLPAQHCTGSHTVHITLVVTAPACMHIEGWAPAASGSAERTGQRHVCQITACSQNAYLALEVKEHAGLQNAVDAACQPPHDQHAPRTITVSNAGMVDACDSGAALACAAMC